MMKNKILFIAIIAMFFGSFGCEDILDRTPLDKISDADVWQDESLMKGYVVDLYNRFPDFAYTDFYKYCDESTTSGGNGNAVTMGTMSKSNVPGEIEYWDYEYIRDCNVFFENVEDSPISDELKIQYTGVVKVMRAIAYFEMAKRYGGVPLVTEVIDPYGEIPESVQKRSTEEAIHDFVDMELEEAIDLLEDTDDVKPTALINKWAALGFKARANLWAASIAKYGSVEANGLVGVPASRADEFYNKASEAAVAVLSSDKYALYEGQADPVTNYQYIILDEGNSEIIFAKEYNGVEVRHDWDHWKAPARFASGQGSRCNPTLDFILRYENVDGSEEDYTQYFNTDYLYESGLELFERKDPRLLSTVLFQNSWFVNDNIQTYEGIDTSATPNMDAIKNNPNHYYNGYTCVGVDSRLTIGDDKNTNSGFLIRKWCDEPNLPVPAGESQVDWPILRLAEMYLTVAEAEFELGNTGPAVEAINATRERAGISLATGGSISMDLIQTEWMAEFAFENKRYWDLRRWRIAEEVLNHHFQGLRIIWHFDSEQYYFLPLNAESFNRVFRPEHYYNPISTSRINNNPLLEQNPLY